MRITRRFPRVVHAAVILCVAATIGACGQRGWSRDTLHQQWIQAMIDNGVAEPVAECIIDRFFQPMSDDELREFNLVGDSLTDSQQATVDQLVSECDEAFGE